MTESQVGYVMSADEYAKMFEPGGVGFTKVAEIKLNELAMLRAQADAARDSYQARIDALMAPIQAQIDSLLADVAADLEELQRQQAEAVAAIEASAARLQDEAENLVKLAGQSVKGERLQAVYNAGRVTWDSKRLEGYAVAHPEVSAFRKVGEPFVTWRNR